MERLRGQILRRDRILNKCYYRVQQVRDNGHDKLLEQMKEWAPKMPASMRPRVYSKGVME